MTEIDLNDLTLKTDSLPDNWKMLLIDPATGQPAQNITIAKFIEFLTNKIPDVTENNKGMCSNSMYIAALLGRDIIGYYPNKPGSVKDFNEVLAQGLYGIYKPMDVMNSPGFNYGILLVLSFMGFTVQLAFSGDWNIYYRLRTDAVVWSSWRTLQFNSTSLLSSSNPLTEAISLNNNVLPPPRKLRAKQLTISKFHRAICGVRSFGFCQQRRINSS